MIANSFIARLMQGAMALAVVVGVSSANAQSDIVNSQGFESPLFTTTFAGTGQLEGQTPATFNGTWVRTKGPGFGTATVQSLIVDAGAQAVQVNRLPNSDDRWGVPVDGYPSINTPYVCIEWRMRVEQSSGLPGTFGPFFGVEAYDDDAAFVGLAGSLGVDASNGEVLIQEQDTGFLTAPGPTVAFGAWNTFLIELNYLNNTYRTFLNGALLAPAEGFVDQNNIPGGLDEFTDANIAAIAAAGDAGSQALGGTAFFDNFRVLESPLPCDFVIPEPATGLLALAGLLGLAMRRRAGFSRA
jgi:hypothetical protein